MLRQRKFLTGQPTIGRPRLLTTHHPSDQRANSLRVRNDCASVLLVAKQTFINEDVQVPKPDSKITGLALTVILLLKLVPVERFFKGKIPKHGRDVS